MQNGDTHRVELCTKATIAGCNVHPAKWWPELAPLTRHERDLVRAKVKELVAQYGGASDG
jgi:hypothetical protein